MSNITDNNKGRIWLETDYEPDDVAAINILARRNIEFSHIVSGEGDSSIKVERSILYHHILISSHENLCKNIPIFIQGIGSDKPFHKDGSEFDNNLKSQINLNNNNILNHDKHYID